MTRLIAAPPRQIGFWTCLALVIGNTVGTGIFLLAPALAPLGWNALYGWLITIAGGLVLATVFARLARAMPNASGPYDYIADTIGSPAAFFVMWAYWISLWVTNAAIAIGAISYLTPFAPGLMGGKGGPLTAMALVALMTAIALRGVRASGGVQITTTAVKLLLLFAIILMFAAVAIQPGGVTPSTQNIAPSVVTGGAIASAAALTLWSMLGFESGVVPAGRVRDPRRTLVRATIIGTLVVGIVYVGVTFAMFLLLPSEVARTSTAPMADLAAMLWGPGSGLVVAGLAAVSAIGALNGWVFLQAEVPLVLAERGVFPRFFARVNAAGMPVGGHLLGCALSISLLALNLSSGLLSIYNFVILLATVATLVLYLASAAALWVLVRRKIETGMVAGLVALVGGIFALWTFYGAGGEATGWGAVLLATGVPVYFLMRSRARSSPAPGDFPAEPRE